MQPPAAIAPLVRLRFPLPSPPHPGCPEIISRNLYSSAAAALPRFSRDELQFLLIMERRICHKFYMDWLDIVVYRAYGEAAFSNVMAKMVFRLTME